MYSPLGYYDNKPGGSNEDNSAEKLPYRRRNRTPRVNPHEKWKEACLGINPDFDKLSESAKEIIESKLKVDYYIALGADSSLPRTATSGSIQTPRASPLVRRPLRVPSRAPSAPLFPTRQLPPIGPLPPLPLLPNLNPPATVAPVAPLQTTYNLPNLPTFLANNPYLVAYYQEQLAQSPSSTSCNSNLSEDPAYLRRKPPDINYSPIYCPPSTSVFAASQLGQSASSYVNCPSIYGSDTEVFNIFNSNEANNNNDDTTINNNDDQPYDYTIKALNKFNYN